MSEARHGALVLAAGASRRLGTPKQLLVRDGETLLHRCARLALATAPIETIVVVAPGAETMRTTVADLPIRLVECADASSGMAASLRVGVAALSARCDGALIVLTDQPALEHAHLNALCKMWQGDPSRAVASAYAGVLGVPALLPRSWFDEIIALKGDRGARDLLRSRRDVVAIAADALAHDIDEPRDL